MQSIRCPRCRSEAYNHYGHTKNGKQRYICLVCNRQFINSDANLEIIPRPNCSVCGKMMHIYMRNDNTIRFRCSGYPECREYSKLSKEN
jgi:ssDNA-binding Zn-finger/Zn-ribbon topoisomerase 1